MNHVGRYLVPFLEIAFLPSTCKTVSSLEALELSSLPWASW